MNSSSSLTQAPSSPLLSLPTQTAHPSPQKASKSSPTSTSAQPPALVDTLPALAYSPIEPGPSGTQDDFPARVRSGLIAGMGLAASEVKVFVNGSGVSYRQCTNCDQVMGLSNDPTHLCIGHTKEPGPHPSKYPRLPADRRTLPTASSHIQIELDVGWVTVKAKDYVRNDSSSVRVVDKSTGILIRKRKVESPSQQGLTKKPHTMNHGGPGGTEESPIDLTGDPICHAGPGGTEENPIDLTGDPLHHGGPGGTQEHPIDLTGDPIRIPTPESARTVNRD